MVSEYKESFIQQTAQDYDLDFDLVLKTYQTENSLISFYDKLEQIIEQLNK